MEYTGKEMARILESRGMGTSNIVVPQIDPYIIFKSNDLTIIVEQIGDDHYTMSIQNEKDIEKKVQELINWFASRKPNS